MSRRGLYGLLSAGFLALASGAGLAGNDIRPRRGRSGHVGADPSMRYDWWPISTINRSADPARRKAKKTKNRGANASRGKTYAQLFGPLGVA